MANSRAEILGFRRTLRTLAHALAKEQGMTVKAPASFDTAGRTKRHTCEKAAVEFRKEAPCAECEYELRVKERLTTLLGEPVSRNA